MKSREVALVAQEQNNNDEIVIYNTKDIQRILKIGKIMYMNYSSYRISQ